MIRTKLAKILSLNGLSVTVGIVGFLMALLTILVGDWNFSINIKWFFFLFYTFLCILLLASKLTYELYIDLTNNTPVYSRAISFLPSGDILLVENNKFLDYLVMTTIYYSVDGIEKEFAIGYVCNVQNQFTQIKLSQYDQSFTQNHKDILQLIHQNNILSLNNIIVKNHFKFK